MATEHDLNSTAEKNASDDKRTYTSIFHVSDFMILVMMLCFLSRW